jgi:hypothetical protein
VRGDELLKVLQSVKAMGEPRLVQQQRKGEELLVWGVHVLQASCGDMPDQAAAQR